MKNLISISTLALALASCGNRVIATTTGDCRTNEGGACLVEASGQTLQRGAQACTRRAAPYATSTNATFSPFTLPQCNGDAYPFYNQGYCDAKLTLTMISAGWCQPCRLEATTMQEAFVHRFENCGLRVVQVLVQDNNSNEPTQAFCEGWVRQYGLTNPVLRDQNNTISPLFPANSLPTNLLVDQSGTIVYRQSGVNETTMLAQVRAELTRAGADLATCEQR